MMRDAARNPPAGGDMLQRRCSLLMAATLFGLGCGSPDQTQPAAGISSVPARSDTVSFDWQRSIGVAARRGDTLCLRVQASMLQSGTRVLLVSPHDQVVAGAAISESLASCADEVPGLDYSFYRLVPVDSLEVFGPLIALIAPNVPLPVSTPVRIDLDLDGMTEQFRACTSSEGLHLTIWSGEPLVGSRRWHYYYYLGYDVEPDCVEQDFAAEPPVSRISP